MQTYLTGKGWVECWDKVGFVKPGIGFANLKKPAHSCKSKQENKMSKNFGKRVTGNRKRETGKGRQETGDGKRETGNGEQPERGQNKEAQPSQKTGIPQTRRDKKRKTISFSPF
jgi:hypothetical protein